MTPRTEPNAAETRAGKTAPQSVEPPGAFRAFAWDDVPDGSLRKYACGPGGVTLYAPSGSAASPDLLGVPVAAELYHFAFGKFYLGQAFLDGRENFLRMKDALTAAYGRPALRNDLTEVYVWQWNSAGVEVRLHYHARHAKSTVEFRNGQPATLPGAV